MAMENLRQVLLVATQAKFKGKAKRLRRFSCATLTCIFFTDQRIQALVNDLRTRGVDSNDTDMTSEKAELLFSIWESAIVQKSVQKCRRWYVTRLWHWANLTWLFDRDENAGYFLDRIDQIADPKYLPSDEDLLRMRAKSMGINEVHFKWQGCDFLVVDVGGQRSERRKWIHCFENVNVIIFVMAISDYDLNLEEDEATHRLADAMDLFANLINSELFRHMSVVVFLNKLDVFTEKFDRVPLRDHCNFKGSTVEDGEFCLYFKLWCFRLIMTCFG